MAPCSGTVSGGGTVSSSKLGISANDVNSIGGPQTRTASTYGGVLSDFTTYLDVAPSQRPPAATQYWQNKGYNIQQQESNLNGRGIKTGTLNLSDTSQGKFAGNLIPGFDIGVPANNSYGLKGGSIVYIADKNGAPVGPNGGYFRVGDTGSSKALTTQSATGAVDFYAGNDPELTKYFSNLNGTGTQLDIQPVDVTGDSAENLKKFITENGSDANIAAANAAVGAQIPGTGSMNVVNNTDGYGRTPVMNTNDMASGLFAYPNPGAMVWVFFREGNPLYPVYFAASYSSKEWSSAYRGGSPATGYSNDGKQISKGTNMKFGPEGGIWTKLETNLDDTTGIEEKASVSLYHKGGSSVTFDNGIDFYHSHFARRDEVEHDRFVITKGYKEQWVEGDDSLNVKGDLIIKVGKFDEESMKALQALAKQSAETNAKLTKSS